MSALPQSMKVKVPFRITGDGWYKTRDGKTVKVYLRDLSGAAWRWWSDNSGWHNDAGEFNLRGIPGDDIVARVTKPRTPAKPKAARQGRYHTERGHSFWSVTDRTKGPGGERLVAIRMTRSTARKLAALMNREAK